MKTKKSAAKVPAKKIINKISKKMRVAPPKAKFDTTKEEMAEKMPQRKTNKSMKGLALLAKGMKKIGNGHK